MSINKVIVIGNLGRDPELKNENVCKLRLAVTRPPRKDSTEEMTDWFDVAVLGKPAQVCAKVLSKGSRVCVEGRLENQEWTDVDTGDKRSKIEIIANRVEFL